MSWAYVNSQGSEQTGINATMVQSPSWSVGVGNLLFLGITSWQSPAVASYTVVDNKGNTWHKVDSRQNGTTARGDVWYTVVTTGGSGLQITITPNASAYIVSLVAEFSCSGTPSLVDHHATAGTNTPAACSSVTVTGNCVLLGWLDNVSATAITAGSGFTIPTGGNLFTHAAEDACFEYALNVTTSQAVFYGDNASSSWTVYGVSFSEGGSSAPTTATLSGPTSGTVGVASTNFTITLDYAAQSGGVSCTITDSVGGDTITSTPVVIASGQTTGTFTITPSTTGNRTITLASTSPTLTIAGSPITYNSLAPATARRFNVDGVLTWDSHSNSRRARPTTSRFSFRSRGRLIHGPSTPIRRP